MKKVFLTGICCLIIACTFAQTIEQQPIKKQTNLQATLRDNNIYTVDSTICFQFNEDLAALVLSTREVTLEANTFGNILQKRADIYDISISDWKPSKLLTANFNSNESLTQYLEQEWNSTTQIFENKTKSTYTLNGAGQSTEVITQVWENDNWVNFQKEHYEYGSGANAGPTLFLFQNWEAGSWVNSFQTLNNYNAQNLVASTIFQTYVDNAWLNGNRTFESYNASNLSTESRREVWNVDMQDWVLSSQVLRTYEENNNTEMLSQVWDDFNQVWLNQTLVSSDFEGDKRVEELSQYWFDDTWIDFFKTQFQYDLEGNLTRTEGELFVEGNWRAQNACDLYWSLFSTNVFETFENQIQCTIPNPFRTGASFSCENLNLEKNYKLAVFDINGIQHFSKKINETNDIFINKNLPNGMYILVIKNEDGLVFRQKIIAH